jgi:hypothetical protein
MGGELIRTEELAQILHEADVRIFDCTTRLDYQPPGSDIPYIPVPGLGGANPNAFNIPGNRSSSAFWMMPGAYDAQEIEIITLKARVDSLK